MPRHVAHPAHTDPRPTGPTLVWPGKHDPGQLAPVALPRRDLITPTGTAGAHGGEGPPSGMLFCGDNRQSLSNLLAEGFAGRVQMIYIDPPFKSGADYARPVSPKGTTAASRRTKVVQYSDVWSDEAYLQFMYERLLLLRPLLSPQGSLFLHCDFRTAHHLRCLLDEIFGPERCRNELIWAYGGSARGAKAIANQFARNHDLILWYGNGPKPVYTPITSERRVPLAEASRYGFRQDAAGQWFKTAPRGDYTDASIARLEAEGRIHRTRNGTVRIKYPLRSDGRYVYEEAMVGDVWTDIPDAMHSADAETYAYPTRKPEALLERIIRCSTQPGDWVLDAFVGSGTTVAVAQRLDRRWIGCDANPAAIQLTARRLHDVISRSAPLAPRPTKARSTNTAVPPPVVAVFGMAEPAPSPVEVVWQVRREGAKLVIHIDDVRSPRLQALLAKSLTRDPEWEWRQLIDGLVIDPAYDGETFRWHTVDFPRQPGSTVAGRYELPMSEGAVTVAMKLVDVTGEATLVTGAVEPSRLTRPSASA